MLNDTAQSTVSWYTLIVKELDERYLDLVGSKPLNNLKAGVDLRNDYAFKYLFGSIGNERILIGF